MGNSLGRYSRNELNTLPEVGNTSSWVIAFQGSRSGVSSSALNLISNKYIPASDVSYVNYTVQSASIQPGGLYKINYVAFADTIPDAISVTVYDTDLKSIRKAMINWVANRKWRQGQSKSLGKLKEEAAKLTIWHFTKDMKKQYNETFLVLPGKDMDFKGDQSFNADTLALDFIVIGMDNTR